LAFTLANGFTYVEYYLSRGMSINDFGPNLSFFFSNGIDPEYAVIGRVARRIWAKSMKQKYGADARTQMLKYHIQTSGRSLHAQEIDFNDIRTTLQALYAIYDNCNSLHTNAYDEAITTPTEESVRRAMAIQLIINRELGLAKNENPLQGSFIIEEMTDLVEEAVLAEFDRITERGGVLGAMETMYQRGKIQEESLHYEMLKHTGEYPIIGVNTFLSSKGSPTVLPKEVIRATTEEKEFQIQTVQQLQQFQGDKAHVALRNIQEAAIQNRNIFIELMEAAKVCSLGQITQALFEVGGQYRRNTVDRLAHLARLEFNADEKQQLVGEMNNMLAFVEKLNELDTDSVAPLVYLSDSENVFREDEPKPWITHQEALQNAAKKDTDFIRVPKVIDQSGE
jgi:methylmalonyl-CoA mutase